MKRPKKKQRSHFLPPTHETSCRLFKASPTVDSALSHDDVLLVGKTLARVPTLKETVRTIEDRIRKSGIFNATGNGINVYRLAPMVTSVPLDQSPAYGKILLLQTPDDGIDGSEG